MNEEHTIFGVAAAVGIAISFLVKKRRKAKELCQIRYIQPCDIRATRDDKFAYLQTHPINEIDFDVVKPDNGNHWINIPDNDFSALIALADKKTKSTKVAGQERAIFKRFSFGVVTNRDEWVYSENLKDLENKVTHLISIYNDDCARLKAVRDPRERADLLDKSIKWTRAVKGDLAKGVQYKFNSGLIGVALHVGYETIDPWSLERIDAPDEKSRKAGLGPKVMLKADKDAGSIRLDSESRLTGVPPEVWTYKLGNRSAIEWVLDQYREKTPKDPTIREKFNTYRFADHKEKVIDLLKRVTRVSVETMKIVEAMRKTSRSD